MRKPIPDNAVLVPDGAELAFEGMIFDVYQWQQKLFDGSEHRFEMLKRADTVNAICVVDGRILVIEDEQPHLGKRRSLPGGRVDAEDAGVEAAARREILEETGHSFKNWRLIKVAQPYRKIEWFVYTFLAWEETGKQEPSLDPGEKIIVQAPTFDEAKSLAMDDIGSDGQSYLGESAGIFQEAGTLEGLLAVPEFTGREVDR